jgi:hypothetical protein
MNRFLLAIGTAALIASFPGCGHLPWASRDAGVKGPATVTGQVTSDRGAILADAAVTLSGPSVRRQTRTGVTGRFTFEQVPLGRYVVSVSAAGYKSAKQTVTVDKEASVRADLKLRM